MCLGAGVLVGAGYFFLAQEFGQVSYHIFQVANEAQRHAIPDSHVFFFMHLTRKDANVESPDVKGGKDSSPLQLLHDSTNCAFARLAISVTVLMQHAFPSSFTDLQRL